MKKLFIFFLLSLSLSAFSQNKEMKEVGGHVVDHITKQPISNDIKVRLLTKDSVLVTNSADVFQGNYGKPATYFEFKQKLLGDYIIEISYPNYDTLYKNITIKDYKRERMIYVGLLEMKRSSTKEKQLGMAVVQATRVKIYHKNDTVVFNADAFQLAEGSMLDALIRQLPGVELKSDGQIMVNGRYVESLLLDGKDFFRNDRSVALENLPAYMINNVQVYEKASETDEFMNRTSGQKSYVMDVKLKKQYQIGWIGNAEVAGGTKDRYLARLFALRFTDHSRVSFFANTNNVNERRKPGENGDWTPDQLTNGLLATKVAGIDYTVTLKNQPFKELKGNIKLEHTDGDYQSQQHRENFFAGGNTFQRMTTGNKNKNFNLAVEQSYRYRKTGRLFGGITPSFNYTRQSYLGYSQAALFSADPASQFSKEQLDSIYLPGASQAIRQWIINRTMNRTLQKSNSLQTGASGYLLWGLPHTSDYVGIDGEVSYNRTDEDMYRHYQLEYPASETAAGFLNQYTASPTRNYRYNVKAYYMRANAISQKNIQPFYRYSQRYAGAERSLYQLAQLSGWDNEATAPALGILPSVAAAWQSQTLDRTNSYESHFLNRSHQGGLIISKDYDATSRTTFRFTLPVRFDQSHLNYHRNRPYAVKRNVVFFEPDLEYTWGVWGNGMTNVYHNSTARFNVESSVPALSYLLDIRDDADPLNITLGNADLKNSHRFTLRYEFHGGNIEKQHYVNFDINYKITHNAIAMGTVYDKVTGVKTFTPDNINGNYEAWFGLHYSSPLDKQKKLSAMVYTIPWFTHSVDLITVDRQTSSARSSVSTISLNNTFTLDYTLSKDLKLGVKLNGIWNNTSSRRSDFQAVHSWTFRYGVNGTVELPWAMQASTDLTMYSRRGYAEASMNTDELVWNTRLAKRVSNLTLALEGFDLLGNLSNVTRFVNAQGRTESYQNVLPRYWMLHVIYRLNIQPKKQ